MAERINGILKYEYGFRHTLRNLQTAQQMIKQEVDIYNHQRIHWSLGLQTPAELHRQYDKHRYRSYAKNNIADKPKIFLSNFENKPNNKKESTNSRTRHVIQKYIQDQGEDKTVYKSFNKNQLQLSFE